MNAQDIQRMIDQTEYWDVNILDFKTAFFGDEAFSYIFIMMQLAAGRCVFLPVMKSNTVQMQTEGKFHL